MNQINFETELASARDRLENDLDQLVQLRPLPAIAMQVMKACREQQSNVRDVVQLIECDAAISSRILSVVNSSVYGYSREVTSIKQSVVVLGFKNLSQLAVSIASEKVFSEGDSAAQPRAQLYEHSLGCASISRLLVNSGESQADSGAAFLAGMLHDVGKLVFFDIAPDFYTQLQSHPDSACNVESEQAAFGIDHAAVGANFGRFWGLPAEISTTIANHHCPGDECDPLLSVTSLANELAKSWGVGQIRTETGCAKTSSWLKAAGPEKVETLYGLAQEQFGELKSLMTN